MEHIENLLDWFGEVWKALTWRDMKLMGAGGCWGAALLMVWQYFDTMSAWPFPAILFVGAMWAFIGWLLFESAMA